MNTRTFLPFKETLPSMSYPNCRRFPAVRLPWKVFVLIFRVPYLSSVHVASMTCPVIETGICHIPLVFTSRLASSPDSIPRVLACSHVIGVQPIPASTVNDSNLFFIRDDDNRFCGGRKLFLENFFINQKTWICAFLINNPSWRLCPPLFRLLYPVLRPSPKSKRARLCQSKRSSEAGHPPFHVPLQQRES